MTRIEQYHNEITGIESRFGDLKPGRLIRVELAELVDITGRTGNQQVRSFAGLCNYISRNLGAELCVVSQKTISREK